MSKTKMSICSHNDISYFSIGLQKLLKNLEEIIEVLKNFNLNFVVAKKPPIKLTKREREVTKLIAQEKTNNEIAEELITSYSTVKRHIQNILKKTQTRSRAGIAQYAIPEQK